MVNKISNLIIDTREIFDLNGTEKIPLGNVGSGHLSTRTLKEWILANLAETYGISRIDNTPDSGKPLSLSQKMYIDGSIKNIASENTSLKMGLAVLEIKINLMEQRINYLESLQVN